MAVGVYAGSSASGVTALPSPISIKTSLEIIWDENTGRAQSGTNKAKMIGDVVAQKKTYEIQWGVLTQSEYDSIVAKLPAGFFYFAMATTKAGAESIATKYYRSEIKYDVLSVGNATYYKDLTVSVIEQ
jgi:hypothetical protein